MRFASFDAHKETRQRTLFDSREKFTCGLFAGARSNAPPPAASRSILGAVALTQEEKAKLLKQKASGAPSVTENQAGLQA
jgi:hypothetical protein